ncbi:YbjQ family protein [Rhizobium sp. LC145]|uniref:YbjQ family protein n=1 Tax=Rhizobium sp. LC145 TaxID=1120688 RepID=UPI00069CB457|nr:YbjQ family protein [Rhizobium sp. LC145]TKT67062.1 YbjQ family protein [Rhizobiaceae bacterium LC148]
MAKCNQCGLDKPKDEVYLGVCDDCYHGRAAPAPTAAKVTDSHDHIILTTSIDVPKRKVDSVVSIVATEAALGMNILRDIANSFRDTFGGRSESSQKVLAEARRACLDDLKREAAKVGADAVIAVDIHYNEISTGGSGGGILFVAASGTAVRLEPPASLALAS